MSPRTYAELDCSVARTMESIGERWTMLILRDAFYGLRRFDDFRESLGIARNILSARLTTLVDAGIMRKDRYQQHPDRYEYRLTEKGRDLIPVLLTLMAWGNKWDHQEPVKVIHDDCGHATRAVTVCAHCGDELTAHNLMIDPIPPIVVERVVERRLAGSVDASS